jgi:hypothetical protein
MSAERIEVELREVAAIIGARLNGATSEQLRKLVAELHERRVSMRSAPLLSAEVETVIGARLTGATSEQQKKILAELRKALMPESLREACSA